MIYVYAITRIPVTPDCEAVDQSRHFGAATIADLAAVFVVTRPERIVVAETSRLLANLREREIAIAGVIANYLTPENDCPCDRSMRAHELAALAPLEVSMSIERRDAPVTGLDELAALVPLY